MIDRGESNSPPRVRLRTSLCVGVEIFCSFSPIGVVNVRLSSPAKVSKLVSELTVGLLLQTNARLKRQLYCSKLHALCAVIAISEVDSGNQGCPLCGFM